MTQNYHEKVYEFIELMTDDEALQSIEADNGVQLQFVFRCEKNNAIAQAIVPVPPDITDDRAKKEKFMKQIFPKIKEEVKNNVDEIICIAMISEVWKSVDESLLNSNAPLNETNSEEMIMMSFHFKGMHVDYLYPVIRIGGQMKISRTPIVKQTAYGKDEFVGRFSELYTF